MSELEGSRQRARLVNVTISFESVLTLRFLPFNYVMIKLVSTGWRKTKTESESPLT